MTDEHAPDPRTVRAWRLYEESLRGLSGAEYDREEARAWERLQRMLGEIEAGADWRHVDVRV